MDDLNPLLQRAVEHAVAYRRSLAERPVRPELDVDALAPAFGGPLQPEPLDPEQVLEQLAAAAEPGLVATAGPRFFGFVIGGALPAATAA
ncbi:MAG: aspartate aminotransferase family protein, partial [Angustibacter sp.]